MALSSGCQTGRDVHRDPEIVALAVEHLTPVDATPGGREVRLLRGALLDLQRAGDCGARVRKHEHEGVSDLLDDPSIPAAHRLPYHLREALQNLRRRRVAHGLGERGEAGEVDEHDADPQLPRHVDGTLETRVLLQVHDGVFSGRLLHPFVVKVEEHRFDQRPHPVGRRLGGLDELAPRHSLRLQPLMHVEVKEASLRLRDPPEGVGVHASQLHQGLLWKAGFQSYPQCPQRSYVLLVEALRLPADADRLPQSPDRGDVQPHARSRLRERVRAPRPGRERRLHVGGEKILLLVHSRNRLEADPATEQHADEPRPPHVLRPEVIAIIVADEAVRGLHAPLRQLVELESVAARLVRHGPGHLAVRRGHRPQGRNATGNREARGDDRSLGHVTSSRTHQDAPAKPRPIGRRNGREGETRQLSENGGTCSGSSPRQPRPRGALEHPRGPVDGGAFAERQPATS